MGKFQTNYKQMLYNANEHTICYNQKGDKKKLILYVHGWSHSKGIWENIDQSDEYTHIAIDLPGFGNSTVPKSFDYSLFNYSTILKNFVNTLDYDLHAIIAHSMGGLITSLYLNENDTTFKKVAILGSPFEGLPGLKHWFVVPGVARFVMSLRCITPSFIFKNFAGMTIAKENLNKITQEIIKDIRTPSAKTMASSLKNAAFFHIPTFNIQNKEILIVRGEYETILSKEIAEKYSKILNAKLETMPNISHVHALEDPEGLSRILDNFLG